MCPAPLYSYFDAQLLADFIMNSQFPGYDGTNTTAASSDSAFGQLGNMATAFAAADDYDSYDNARVRKRRMTVSDDRRVEDLSSFNIPDVSEGLFSMLDQHHGYVGAMQQMQQHHQNQSSTGHMSASGSSSLPIPPGSSDDSSVNAALASSMSFNGLPFPPNPYASSSSGDMGSPHHLHGNPLSSPPISTRAATSSSGARKHQSLSIAINRGHSSRGNNE
ncbi:hypothetical protein GGI21_000750 [Coemansia aciculifera]|nr:hypothetical protein GGI21_000750 [Coemansia aciculifera]